MLLLVLFDSLVWSKGPIRLSLFRCLLPGWTILSNSSTSTSWVIASVLLFLLGVPEPNLVDWNGNKHLLAVYHPQRSTVHHPRWLVILRLAVRWSDLRPGRRTWGHNNESNESTCKDIGIPGYMPIQKHRHLKYVRDKNIGQRCVWGKNIEARYVYVRSIFLIAIN